MQEFDLKRFRVDNKLTQANLADLFSCNQNFISRIENGIRPMPDDKLDILQSEYGDISMYFRPKAVEKESHAQTIMSIGADAFTMQLMQMMNDKLIAPYALLEEKDKQIEALNRKIGMLEEMLGDRKKMDVHQEEDADHADAM